MTDNSAAICLRAAYAHDEAADRHMEAAVHWRDHGQAQRAVLEVKHAMLERQLAQLARHRSELEARDSGRSAATNGNLTHADAGAIPTERVVADRDAQGTIEVVYKAHAWHVEIDGKPDSIHRFRIAAIVVGHEAARRARRELVIRGRDGAPRERVSYRDNSARKRAVYRQPELRRA